MRFQNTVPARREADQLPLINIVFLILVFLPMVGTSSPTYGLDVKTAKAIETMPGVLRRPVIYVGGQGIISSLRQTIAAEEASKSTEPAPAKAKEDIKEFKQAAIVKTTPVETLVETKSVQPRIPAKHITQPSKRRSKKKERVTQRKRKPRLLASNVVQVSPPWPAKAKPAGGSVKAGDREVMNKVHRAAPFRPIPKSTGRSRIAVRLPVKFRAY